MARGTDPRISERAGDFREAVLAYYREHGRDLPWRHTRDPYSILVSEMMLQQTQVARVLSKYGQFLAAFPTITTLARAPVADVLSAWQGLGYNRRALALHRSARLVVDEQRGTLPRSPAEFGRLPGIGPATAAAVSVFAYNLPLVFIETNIRSAFIHFFFQECRSVSDADILPLVDLTLDRDNPRDWYYALMDFGAWVKKTHTNPNQRSAHYSRQTPFAGSRREARALILRTLLAVAPSGLTPAEIETAAQLSGRKDLELNAILEQMTAEGFLTTWEGRYRIA